MLAAVPIGGIGEISPGFDLAAAVVTALDGLEDGTRIEPGDVLVIAHKAVSKAE